MGRHLKGILPAMVAFAIAIMALSSPIPAAATELDPDLYLELWNTGKGEPYDEHWTVAEGHVTFNNPNTQQSAEFSWTIPPKTIDAAGVSLTLSVSAASASSYFSASMSAGASDIPRGIRFEPSDNSDGGYITVGVEVKAGENKSNSVIVLVKPEGPLEIGQRVTLGIGPGNGTGVGYTYFVKSRRGTGTGQLTASIDDCPATIMISAYPPLNCHITISGYRKNTADEVEVLFPAELDTFGNHANGIQLSGRGKMTVFAMHEEDPYSWGLFIFACPSQPNAGMNCYENVAVPGVPVTVPIIVRQANGGSVTVSLTFTPVPHD